MTIYHINSRIFIKADVQSVRRVTVLMEPNWSVNMWADILGDHLFGPYLLPERLLGHSYFVFLCDVLPDFLYDIPLAAIHGLWFQEDGNTVDTL